MIPSSVHVRQWTHIRLWTVNQQISSIHVSVRLALAQTIIHYFWYMFYYALVVVRYYRFASANGEIRVCDIEQRFLAGCLGLESKVLSDSVTKMTADLSLIHI